MTVNSFALSPASLFICLPDVVGIATAHRVESEVERGFREKEGTSIVVPKIEEGVIKARSIRDERPSASLTASRRARKMIRTH